MQENTGPAQAKQPSEAGRVAAAASQAVCGLLLRRHCWATACTEMKQFPKDVCAWDMGVCHREARAVSKRESGA